MITALYERLSRDDEQVGESNSITRKPIWRIMPSSMDSPIVATTQMMVIAAEILNAPDGNDS